MMRHTAAIATGIVAAFLAGAGAASAQEAVWVGPAPAWLGLSYEVEWLDRGGSCEPRVVVESVIQGAPADRAGLRPGDALLAVNGVSLGESRLRILASRLSVGDSVRLTVGRDGRTRSLLAVADRRPHRPPVVLRSADDGLFRSDAPLIRLRGDTVVARNLDAAALRAGGGYWIAHGDGRAEFRRVDRFSGSALDRRVGDLLVCAHRSAAAAPMAARSSRITVQQVQQEADSLREVLLQRVRSRPQAARVSVTEGGRVIELTPEPTTPPPPAGVAVYSFRVADHLAAGERGIAGAELATLEPELASYFRGVRDGLLVLRVAPGTPADRAGLRPGDVITAGSGRSLETLADLRLLLTLPDPTPVELRVVRHGRSRTLTIRRD